MQNPRGSNDRLNETSTNRNNANRVFDSQNNAKGGYCWGPPLYYYVGSVLPIEWTNQHSCGSGNPNCLCNIVLQYSCHSQLRDGIVTTTIPDDETQVNNTAVPVDDYYNGQATYVYGMHEPYEYYQDCKTRSRNNGLFTADQNVGNQAINTRQNPGGNRHGFECPEERDYYPYWHASIWKDIAVMTDDLSLCPMYRSNSQNVAERGYCSDMRYNNVRDCTNNAKEWRTSPAWNIDPPECVATWDTRDNHLGNTINGYNPTYNWTIPDDVNPSCTLRIRYNISTTDFNPWTTDSMYNGVGSPVKNNPTLNFISPNGTYFNLTLAVNTAQFARTFQDRSFSFEIRARPSNVPLRANIFNVNVRGKRGNIVQTYPATEYDFVPQVLNVALGDYIHFQWTGCDQNPAGNDGEGTPSTDRSNVVMLKFNQPGRNYFEAANSTNQTLFTDDQMRWNIANVGQVNCSTVNLGNTDQQEYCCWDYATILGVENNNAGNARQNTHNCAKLNAARRYYDNGLMRVESSQQGASYSYIGTRNNNFTNRSQKGWIFVMPNKPLPAIMILVIAFFVITGVTVIVIPVSLLAPTVVTVIGASLSARL